MPQPPWLVTGAAGFIGYHLVNRLAGAGLDVVGLDNLSDSYDPVLKKMRAEQLAQLPGVRLELVDVADATATRQAFERYRPHAVVHLAARAGVRQSHVDPFGCLDANVIGFGVVLEQCRLGDVQHVVYASSSAVYGGGDPPFSTDRPADHPISLYGATKRMNELQAHAYSHRYGLATTGLRLFTAYGPWGRPDMAYYRFAEAIWAGEPLTVFGDGSAERDFTYVDDVVEAVLRVAAHPPTPDPTWSPGRSDALSTSTAPWRVLNVGCGATATVTQLVGHLELMLGRSTHRLHLPAQPVDLPSTRADTGPLAAITGFTPSTTLEQGLERFVEWFRDYVC